MVNTRLPVNDPILAAMVEGKTTINIRDFDRPELGHPPQLLSHWMLKSVMRGYVIKKIKEPLMKILILVAKRLPPVTKENTNFKNTHTLIDIFDRFFELENNHGREEMFRAAFKLFLAEIEHDIYYRDRFNWFIEEIIKAILRGDWEERTNGHPMICWKEKGQYTEYGGKYSIIQILQNKQRLEALLGDDWKLPQEATK